VEKDGSSLSDEKQMIQNSLFGLLQDFLKSPTTDDLHSVLAYILTVGEKKQVEIIYVFPELHFFYLLTFLATYLTFIAK